MMKRRGIVRRTIVKLMIVLGLVTQVWGAGIERASDGRIRVEDVNMGLAITLQSGRHVEQQERGVLIFGGEGPRQAGGGLQRDGTFHVNDVTSFNLVETVTYSSPNERHLRYEFSTEKEGPTKHFSLLVRRDTEAYRKYPLIIDGAMTKMPGRGELWLKGYRFQLPLRHGMLELTFPEACEVAIRLGPKVLLRFVFGFGKLRNAKVDVTIRYLPYQSTFVDLRSVMNMGFSDSIADDGRGGWTDQGADNDLASIKLGRLESHDAVFQIVDPSHNGGVSCIALRGKERPYFVASARVSVPRVSGETLFLLNALAWTPGRNAIVGKVIVTYADGKSEEHVLRCGVDTDNFWHPRTLDHANVGWRGRNKSCDVGLYVTRIPLCSKAVVGLEFRSANQVWLIVGASIGFARPIEQATRVVIRRGPDWIPLQQNVNVIPDSVADLSSLLHRPAGRYGMVTIRNGHFEFWGRRGVPVRFWGCNLCSGAQFDTPEATRQLLDCLAACGYNAIRLHHFDNSLVTRKKGLQDTIDPRQLKKLDYLVAEAKKRGIYTTLDLFSLRWWAKIPKYGQLKRGEYKLLCYFDAVVRDDLLRFATSLLAHTNPYTGLRWADDPALIFINLVNEGTLLTWYPRANARCKVAIDAAFQRFFQKLNLPDSQQNRIDYLQPFLACVGKDFFRFMKENLTDLGVRIPLCDQNFNETAGDTRHLYDYIDTHFYWGHPTAVSNRSWESNYFTTAESAVSAGAGGLRYVFHAAIYGKPMVISEWNFCYPNPQLYEGPLLTGAYGALQDFSGLMQFYFSGSAGGMCPQPLGPFLIGVNPLQRLAARTGAMFFLRGDVSSSKQTILATRKASAQIGGKLPFIYKVRQLSSQAPEDLPLLLGKDEMSEQRGQYGIPRGTDEALWLGLQRMGLAVPDDHGQGDRPIVSSTGELVLDAHTSCFKVMTSRSEALTLPAKGQAAGRLMTVVNGDVPAGFFLGSRDGSDLRDSCRIMLLYLTDVKSEGAVFSDKDMTTLEEVGGKHLLLRHNRAELSLRLSRPFRLFACDDAGKRLREIPMHFDGTKHTLTLDNCLGDQGIMLYELIAN